MSHAAEPVEASKVPAAQLTHAPCPVLGWLVPAPQLLHAEAPAAEYLPVAQEPEADERHAAAQ